MRILIYSETDAAKVKLAELRAEGHHASLRNPYFFKTSELDKACDLVVADDANVLDAYLAAGIAVERLTPEATAVDFVEESLPTADDTEKVSTPKTTRNKSKTEK